MVYALHNVSTKEIFSITKVDHFEKIPDNRIYQLLSYMYSVGRCLVVPSKEKKNRPLAPRKKAKKGANPTPFGDFDTFVLCFSLEEDSERNQSYQISITSSSPRTFCSFCGLIPFSLVSVRFLHIIQLEESRCA